ncbi:MAG TPA: hypothetical protein VIF62_24750 [Labilithrix sp.]|jgi:hypothetical protein
MKELSTTDPRAHVLNVKAELDELVDHLRRDVAKVTEPEARALFQTATEVLAGLRKAFASYEHADGAMEPGPV